MLRSAFALGLVLATAGVALADIAPPPPPKGFKYIARSKLQNISTNTIRPFFWWADG